MDMPAITDLHDPQLYINRELSQLAFNARVLAQAHDPAVPLLERLRFLCITCTNLDEFFEIRAATVLEQKSLGVATTGADGLTPAQALARIREEAMALVQAQYALWNGVLQPAMASEGIRVILRDAWNEEQRDWLRQYFREQVLPVLSPLGLDPAHPFPRILNRSLNFAVLVSGKDAFGREAEMALVRAPRSLPRVIRLPPDIAGAEYGFVFLSAVMGTFMDELFPGMQVTGSYQFRVTRNGELLVDQEEVEDLAHALKDELRERSFARAVRLEVADVCPPQVAALLARHFELDEQAVYRCDGPVNLNRVAAIYDLVDRPDLKYAPFKPRIVHVNDADTGLFEQIDRHDLLLHHPFDSFSTVIELLRQAALDPDVLAIKQTLYRAGIDSPIVQLLIEAARNGKDVTVVVELRARFDEEANIHLANQLQEAGVQVVYGVVGYKTHAKMMLIVRRQDGRLRRYVHLSTGNYHPGTAKAYTDIGLMTSHAELAEDVGRVFLQLSGLGSVHKLRHLLQSPFTLHKGILARIRREADHAAAGRPSGIRACMNALTEAEVIRALYTASQAGVPIDLIVRGACALRPGLPGVSENITVRSVVGRFLEHSRAYWFANGGDAELYCASADWMERNLLLRVEACFPILDPALADRVVAECLDNYLADNSQAWQLQADGIYLRLTPGDQAPHSAQQHLLAQLAG
ncbi:MAG: polyphosphate kinase 1 [Xanthomonadales bacterium]|nr:polyphosphate kinase 1 [Xanthomonadales bacterium]